MRADVAALPVPEHEAALFPFALPPPLRVMTPPPRPSPVAAPAGASASSGFIGTATMTPWTWGMSLDRAHLRLGADLVF